MGGSGGSLLPQAPRQTPLTCAIGLVVVDFPTMVVKLFDHPFVECVGIVPGACRQCPGLSSRPVSGGFVPMSCRKFGVFVSDKGS